MDAKSKKIKNAVENLRKMLKGVDQFQPSSPVIKSLANSLKKSLFVDFKKRPAIAEFKKRTQMLDFKKRVGATFVTFKKRPTPVLFKKRVADVLFKKAKV
jgi:hypothetical protein